MVFHRLIAVRNTTNGILNQIRHKSMKIAETPVGQLSHVEKIVTTNDCTTFVAWHPSHTFDYEYSLPLPPPSIETDSLLKQEAIKSSLSAFGNKHPEIAKLELMKITNTSFHTWKPRQRDRKAKKTEMDREYL